MKLNKIVKKCLLVISFYSFLSEVNAASNSTAKATGCPNPRHMVLSCGAEYDYCNGGGFAGLLAALVDWIAMDIEYCSNSEAKRRLFQDL